MGGIVLRGGVGMEREKEIGAEPAGNGVAIGKVDISVVVSGEGDADAGRRGDLVPDGAGEGERHLFLVATAEWRGGTRILAAMTGVDDDQRPVGVEGARNRRQVEIGRASCRERVCQYV